MTERTCPECGGAVSGNRARIYCSDLCKSRRREKSRRERGHYQRESVKQRHRANAKRRYDADVAAGIQSGAKLKAWAEQGKGDQSQCLEVGCEYTVYARRVCKRHYRFEVGLGYAGTDYKARAERYQVAYEYISRRKVYDADGWVCGICSEPVDPTLEYPDPMSVSLDHIVPISRGGGHVRSNLQCSHLDCNIRKGAAHVPREEGRPARGGADQGGREIILA